MIHLAKEILYAILFCIMSIAVWQDFHGYRIANRLIVAGYVMGFFCVILIKGEGAFLQSVFGMIIPLIVMWPLWKMGAFGAGDIKLLSVAGVFLGRKDVLILMWYSLLFGALIAGIKGFIVFIYSIRKEVQKSSDVHQAAFRPQKNSFFINTHTKLYKKNIIHFSLAIWGGLILWMVING